MAGRKAADRPPSEERGELALVLEGQSHALRPSYEAIAAFEAATGKGLISLAQDAVQSRLTLGELAQVACECVRAWGRSTGNMSAQGVNSDRIAELLLEADGGVAGAMRVVGSLLAMAATGGYTAQGEPKPTTGTTSGAPVVG